MSDADAPSVGLYTIKLSVLCGLVRHLPDTERAAIATLLAKKIKTRTDASCVAWLVAVFRLDDRGNEVRHNAEGVSIEKGDRAEQWWT